VGPVSLLTNNALFFDGKDQVQYLIPEEWQTGTFSVEFDLVLASMGSGPIPPNAALTFEVELIAIVQ
jgi:hypothetical protein